jgi:hypothetical protein
MSGWTATSVHVRENRHVVSKAVVIATGLRERADGHRDVLGLDVGDSENEVFWREFLTSLNDRGLTGVRLVVSDAHPDWSRQSGLASKARPGNAAVSTRSATCSPPPTIGRSLCLLSSEEPLGLGEGQGFFNFHCCAPYV